MSGSRVLHRLFSVHGSCGKSNDIIFSGSLGKSNYNVIFFPGDIQDYKNNMENHRDNVRYLNWNLEDTTSFLNDRFLTFPVNVWTIRASQITYGTFAAYLNFFESSFDNGVPEFLENGCEAITHLYELMKTAVTRINEEQPSIEASINLPFCLIGFSKGACVLTQILYNLGSTSVQENGSDVVRFFCGMTDMYWLDGGHNGQKHLWPTSHNCISSFASHSRPHFHAHVYATPYQVMDEARPWKRRDHRIFINLLKRYKIPHTSRIFFAPGDTDDPDKYSLSNKFPSPSLEMHFEILKEFPLRIPGALKDRDT